MGNKVATINFSDKDEMTRFLYKHEIPKKDIISIETRLLPFPRTVIHCQADEKLMKIIKNYDFLQWKQVITMGFILMKIIILIILTVTLIQRLL